MPVMRSILITCLSIGLITNVTSNHAADSAQALAFSLVEKYAQLADAAYQSKPKILELSAAQAYTLTHYGNIPSVKVSYFLATIDAEKTHIISVRGTSNVANAFVDIDLQLVENKHAGVRLHRGFAQAAEGIYQEIRPQLNRDYKISTTGHSLGGAVALILAMYLDIDNFNLERVVTFGQPKVTNIPGAKKFNHLNVSRIVTPRDLVPLSPPFDPVDINNLDIYWHLGTEIVLLPDTEYSVLQGLDSMLRATKFIGKPINEENLKYHEMARYLDLIGKKINKATLIPYKNDFDFFGWFGNK